ncbi:MAG: hypothetical protein U0703_13205 [Anaerolineae bacterium]
MTIYNDPAKPRPDSRRFEHHTPTRDGAYSGSSAQLDEVRVTTPPGSQRHGASHEAQGRPALHSGQGASTT